MNFIIVSRHPAAIAYAQDFVAEMMVASKDSTSHCKLIQSATEEDVAGQNVVGNLPMNLACKCARYWAIELPSIAFEQRGKELSVKEMQEAGAKITEYVVRTRTQFDAFISSISNLSSSFKLG